MAVDHVFPRLGFVHCGGRVLNEIDFNDTLMHGMLSFLLFAGALHVDLEGLLAVVHYRAGEIVKTRFDGREKVRNL